ncbi:hypothetical protein DFJ73DRAFT_782754 [Zopfochytrium polystomum]|nr:hypothetical protein DFJ73DRAFT_782754 [Zopfochytrium polystomum]
MTASSSLSPLAIAVVLALAAAGVVAFRLSSRVRFYVRISLFALVIGVASFLGILMVPYNMLIGRLRDSNLWIGYFAKTLGKYVCGVSVRVEGAENLSKERPAVFVVNHQSEMDLIVMGNLVQPDTVILAKDDVKYIPLVGQYMVAAQNIFINRGNRQSAIETMANVAKIMIDKKLALYVFPEGTRSYQTTNEMLPFKKGSFYLAVQGQMPIIPIVTASYHDLYCLRAGLFEGGVIRVKVLPPIETKGKTLDDVHTLLETTQTQMQKALTEISGPLPPYAKPIKIKQH